MVRLTPRERDVLREISLGKSRAKIARSLNLSIHTIDNHIRALAAKLPGDGPPSGASRSSPPTCSRSSHFSSYRHLAALSIFVEDPIPT